MKPLAFKVRTPGHYTGVNGGDIKKGGGGCGAIWYEDKTFTVAATQDQWLCASRAENNYTYNPPKMNPSTKPLRYLSVCSGMEAATVAWHHMGWTPVGFSEIEPFPSAILKHHYPTIPNYNDLTKFKEWNIQPGSVDLLVGGTPCQAFSVAGLRKGLDDPRGNLALTFLALADHLRPKYILWENVPGVLSSSKGRDFASFISALAELRYGFAWRVCDAQYFGVPQRRKRVFLLAIEGAGNWRTAAEILFERKSLCGDIEESDQEGEGVTPDAESSVETVGRKVIGTLDTEFGFGKQTHQSIINGHLIPFRKSKRATSTTDNETWVQADSSNTLNNFDLGDTRTTHAVVYENNRRDGLRIYKGTCPTLQGFMGTGGNNVPMVSEENTIGNKKSHWDGGPHPTLNQSSAKTGGVGSSNQELFAQGGAYLVPGNPTAYSIREDAIANNFSATPLEVTPALQALRPSVQSHHAQTFVAQTIAVRRLTPVECERLQGFPDNYSQIPWKGKPASECPDGPRYKACGNSMAVPVMRWIGERIQKQIDGTL